MFWRLVVTLQTDGSDVSEVGTTWLLVDWTQVEFWVSHVLLEVDGKDVDDGDRDKQHFGSGFGQTRVLLVPPGAIEVEAVDIDTFSRSCCHVFLHHSCHVVVDNDTVQCPSLVCSSHLLPHGRDETLWVEETGHPERVRSSLKHPAAELGISLQ